MRLRPTPDLLPIRSSPLRPTVGSERRAPQGQLTAGCPRALDRRSLAS